MDKKNQKDRRVKKRRQAEEAVRASEVRHQAILEWALDAIISVDHEGRIIEFNKAAETMFGHASKDVIGKEMTTLIIPPALRERHRAGWERHLATGTTSIICKRIEITAMRAGGAEFPIELIVTRFGPDGNPTFTAFIRDISERKATVAREAARLRKLRQLSELGMKLSGDPATVFEHVVRMIGELFEVRVVCLSEIVGGELLFKAVYRNGQAFQDAGRCSLDITPCATVEETKDLRIYDRVMERFPKASFLRDHNAFTYCGFPSIDGEGRVVAVTCLLDDKPHEFSEEDQEILRVIGQRIAAEVERGRSITERKRAASSLKLFRALLDEANDAIEIIDPATACFLDCNEKACSSLGYTREELLSLTVPDIDPIVTLQTFAQYMTQFREGREGGAVTLETVHRRKDGSTFPIEVNCRLVRLDREYVLAIVRDITERKQAEEERARLLREVQDSHERLQYLSRRMLEVQEEERRRLARELHDQTGQSLTSLLVGLRVLEELPTLAEAQAQAGDLRKVTAHALDEVKRLALGLRPTVLDDLGLEAALTRLAQESAKTYGVSVDLHVKGLPNHRLSPPVETGLYRLAQEALTNTGRHAAATNVSILLTCSESSVKLIVEDDGRGFDVEKALRLPGSSHHLGLMGMHERVTLLNGTLSVESTPGSGTTIYVQLPLEARPS